MTTLEYIGKDRAEITDIPYDIRKQYFVFFFC